MAQVPSTTWTPFAVLSAARELAKTADQRKVLQEQGRSFYRLAISEIVSLLNASADPSYWTPAILTIAADQEFLDSQITALDFTAKTITRTGGTFATGSLIDVVMWTKTTDAIVSQFTARITTSGATATYLIISGTDAATFVSGTHGIAVNVKKSLSTSSVNISTLRYDRIIAIHSANAGFCIPVSPSEFFSIGRTDFPHKSYDDDVIWTQMGNIVYFKVGSKITSGIGVVTAYIQRQPDFPAADADYTSDSIFVDLADKWMMLLVKRIYTLCILQTETDIPKNLAQEMALDYQSIAGYTGSELQNKMKKELERR